MTTKKKTVKKATKKVVKKKSTGPDKNTRSVIVGYKSVNKDMASWYDPSYKWTVGKVHAVTVSPGDKDNEPCGVGLHFAPTKKGALSFADDADNCIMLEVQADKKHLLGKDAEKFRVSHLKVNKILETVVAFGKEWDQAKKDAKALDGKFVQPNKAATPKTINAAVAAYAKANGIKKLTPHIVDNVFEANYVLENLGLCDEFSSNYDYDDDRTANEVNPSLGKTAGCMVLDVSMVEEIISGILVEHVSSHRGVSEKDPKETKPLVDLLKMGCLPLGTSKGHFVVFAPKENPFTTKFVY